MLLHKVFIFIISLLFQKCYSHSYVNYTLFRSIPKSGKQLQFLQNISERYYVNFWTDSGSLGRQVDFVISPQDRNDLVKDANMSGVELTLIIDNIQEAFDNQTVKDYIRRRTESFDWRSYFKVDDIYGWLLDLAETYPQEMKVNTIGKTHENRDIMVARIALGKDIRRPKVFIEGGIHAREWISSAFVTYFINEIIHAQYSDDPVLRKVANAYEWHFVPVLNPDGYEYSHQKDRMWRKNRRKDGAVDLNRNFGHDFCSIGSSKDKTKETYCGPHEFSEPESKAMADYVAANNKDLKYYLGFHSFGQMMIIPYAHTKTHLENFNEVKIMTKIAANKIKRRFNTKYISGNAYDTIGILTSGVTGCWVKKTFGVPYVVTFELRDQGRYGFALPTDQILPTCLETMDGVLSLLDTRRSELKLMSEKEIAELRNVQTRIVKNILMIIVMVMFGNVFG